MNLSVNSYGLNFYASKKLIPLSQYKGTVLKLTEADKAEIAKYQNHLAELELDLNKLESLVKRSTSTKETYYYHDKIQKYLFEIDELKAQIANIKKTRLNEQKKLYN